MQTVFTSYYQSNMLDVLRMREYNLRKKIMLVESETARRKQIADDLEDDHNKDWTALNRLFAEILG